MLKMQLDPFTPAARVSQAVANGDVTAERVAAAALERIKTLNPSVNAFTLLTEERALSEARAIDAARARGDTLGPLAGVPFAVKNLFDLEGETTRAGAKVTAADPSATRDGDLVGKLCAAGAVCVGALHMGEFAYDFTGENAHAGPCRNPHDLERMTGGSSSGSGAAVGSGMVPLSLGSDTNGSLRVPASLCGVFSLKPTYGRLSRGGSYPFVDALDHVGPLARTVEDLAIAYDALQGPSTRDHGQASRREEPIGRPDPSRPIRVGVVKGWFDERSTEAAIEARETVLNALEGPAVEVTFDAVEAGRAAAYLITNGQAGTWHLPRLRENAAEFDPDTRDRFLAGALLPAAWLEKAQRVRRWWLNEVLKAFESVDLIVCPATPEVAPFIGQKTLMIGGQEVPLRPNLGLLAQPFSAIGLPVLTVPVERGKPLPLGVQLIAAPWRERVAFSAAARLAAAGVAVAPHPAGLQLN
ncbi:MAG: AtzE family amidohydrolase [Pseudomonadota bacterium]